MGNPEQGTIHYICGINNSSETTTDAAEHFHNTLGKEFAVQPHWVHSDSMVHGLTMVGLEQTMKADPEFSPVSFLSILNPLPTQTMQHALNYALHHSDVQKSINFETEHFSKVADIIIAKGNPNLKQVCVPFSNGGYVMNEALKKLTPEQRNTVVVITAGSTTVIKDGMACETYNIIGDKDWGSRICNGGTKGISRASENANIIPIEQHETDALTGGHYFKQPEYQQEILKTIKQKVTNKYEIY